MGIELERTNISKIYKIQNLTLKAHIFLQNFKDFYLKDDIGKILFECFLKIWSKLRIL